MVKVGGNLKYGDYSSQPLSWVNGLPFWRPKERKEAYVFHFGTVSRTPEIAEWSEVHIVVSSAPDMANLKIFT